jgi:hypothetical protein
MKSCPRCNREWGTRQFCPWCDVSASGQFVALAYRQRYVIWNTEKRVCYISLHASAIPAHYVPWLPFTVNEDYLDKLMVLL